MTALLRDQPFFGSLALRLPIRTDETRETLASDGKDIRYAPQWVADTDADRIKTALARVVLACALKHHTRRGGRDPERWQRASQLVTHGLLRDAGFVLPPGAEAWDGISAEQAYDRLPEPSDGWGGPERRVSIRGAEMAAAAQSAPKPATAVTIRTLRPIQPMTAVRKSRTSRDRSMHGSSGSKPSGQMPASHDPCGTGEVMDADERRDDATGQSGESPVDTPAEEQAWDEAMHQAASLARAQGNAPGAVEETIRQAHRSILDWRSLLRRYMTDAARRDYSWSVPNRRFIDSGLYLPSMHSEGIDAIAIIIDTSASLPGETLTLFWAEVREIAAELQPESIYVLQVDAVLQDAAQYPAGELPDSITIKGRGGTDFRPGFAWLHEHGVHPNCCLYLTDMECDSYPETEPGYPVPGCNWGPPPPEGKEPRALGRAHRHRTGMTPRLVAAGRRPGGMQQVIGFTALQQGRGSIVQQQFNTQVFRPAALLPFIPLEHPNPEPRKLARRLEPGGMKFPEKRVRVHTIRRPVFEREDQSLCFGTIRVEVRKGFHRREDR